MDQTLIKQKVELTFATSFQKPALAVFRNPTSGETELVKISHAGDARGMSPVYNVVDAQGQSAWVPQGQVQIIDDEYLPISPEAFESLRQATSGLTGSSSRSSSSR